MPPAVAGTLAERVDEAIERARRSSRRVIASVTVPLGGRASTWPRPFSPAGGAEERFFVLGAAGPRRLRAGRDRLGMDGRGRRPVTGSRAAAAQCIEVTHEAVARRRPRAAGERAGVGGGFRVRCGRRGGARVGFAARDALDAPGGVAGAPRRHGGGDRQRRLHARSDADALVSARDRAARVDARRPRCRWSTPTRWAATRSRASCRPSATRRRCPGGGPDPRGEPREGRARP